MAPKAAHKTTNRAALARLATPAPTRTPPNSTATARNAPTAIAALVANGRASVAWRGRSVSASSRTNAGSRLTGPYSTPSHARPASVRPSTTPTTGTLAGPTRAASVGGVSSASTTARTTGNATNGAISAARYRL